MCGIAGYYGFGQDRALLETMNSCIQHRGPDGEGYYLSESTSADSNSVGSVGLAHRRLAIVDRAHGQEPMVSADGQTILIYNGEVYNYRELRAELEGLGRAFTTVSDTEVVLQAYEEWGTDAFDRFNGMFGLAILDRAKGRLVLARDHFGIKPLYWANAGSEHEPQLLFASEIKPILATGKIEAKPNERILYRYLRYRIHDDTAETFFEGVNKLLPGEMMTVDLGTGRFRISSFTRLREELEELSKVGTPYTPDVVDEYRRRFTEAIRLRLNSEVPVGSALSGGLDSSAVVVTINRLMQEKAEGLEAVGAKQNTFSAVFPNAINDEEAYADAAIAVCEDIEAHKIKPTPESFDADLEDFVRTMEEPIISSGPYAQYCVMREAAKHVTVLLDGQGADEMMAGYIPYYFAYLRQLKDDGDVATLARESSSSLDIFYRLGRFRLKGMASGKKAVSMATLLKRDWAQKFSGESFGNIPANLKLRLIDDLFAKSLPSLLRYEDKNTMRFSLEGRVPFLDKEVVKYLFSLSDEAIIKEGWNKRVLRDATRGLLPEMISNRRNKIGFTTPEAEWFKLMKERIYKIFMSNSFYSRPYWDREQVLTAFEEYLNGKNDADTMIFWRLLNVELWFREFIDKNEAPADVKAGKSDYEANPGKELDIVSGGVRFRRYPLQTDVFARSTELAPAVSAYVERFFSGLPEAPEEARKAVEGHPWYLLVSEKIVAITQGRSFPVWEIEVSPAARVLSKFVTRTPAGIGLGSPWSMQIAINEVGLPLIVKAAAASVVGKFQGKSGVFYDVVGHNINAIDGATPYSLGAASNSVKLAPKDPDVVARSLSAAVRALLPADVTATFGGTAIMDANDLGVVVMGHDTALPKETIAGMFKDNPQGQGSQATPMSLVFAQDAPAE
ncbi:asparagine synthase (glutamine-hydrolyzing) [Sinomonas sp. JGH33]|uniref:asparagine synthase (glutamine-hydrolyzing) n=1 Tax=Sinomonas terricola TaxID=3110330 RepID=A0ABU5T6S7_9MICC|nr:asparagine synthase (glutamine-hydrolyzing) [Sinomonas sp. JGH33]MEA5455383.1 asparagine synthase (glutamine-hydrolyzing) [Sinomonas sp. JGH33]